MVKAGWSGVLIAFGLTVALTGAAGHRLSAAEAAAEATADPARVLTGDARKMVELAASEAAKGDNLDMLTVAVKLAAQAVPKAKPEIMAIVARLAPNAAPAAAFALDLRPRTAEAAVAAVGDAKAEAAVAETVTKAQQPRFWSFEGWTGSAALSGSQSSGNTEEWSLGASLDAQRAHGRFSYEINLNLDLQTADSVRSKDRWIGALQTNWDLTERTYLYATGQYEQDAFSGFDYQALVSAGAGYRIVTDDRVTWRLQAGPSGRYDLPENGSEGDLSVGVLIDSRTTAKLTDTVTMVNDLQFSQAEGGFREVRNLISLEMPLIDRFALRLSYDQRFRNKPNPGFRKLDTTTKAALAYTF